MTSPNDKKNAKQDPTSSTTKKEAIQKDATAVKVVNCLKQRLKDKEKRILLECGEDKAWGSADVTKIDKKLVEGLGCQAISIYAKDNMELVHTSKLKEKTYKVYKTVLELKIPADELVQVLYDINNIKSWNDSIVESTLLVSSKEIESSSTDDSFDLVYNRIKEYTGMQSHDFVMIRRLNTLSNKSRMISSISVDPSNLQLLSNHMKASFVPTTTLKKNVVRGFANPGGFLIENGSNNSTSKLTWFMNIYCHIPAGILGQAISESFTKKEIQKLVMQLLQHLHMKKSASLKK